MVELLSSDHQIISLQKYLSNHITILIIDSLLESLNSKELKQKNKQEKSDKITIKLF